MADAPGAGIVDGPIPKHRQLRDLLIGMVVPGKAIPSERELMLSYGVSRSTVRKAIDGLVADGLLQRTHGLGTFALRPRLESRLHLASFSQDMRRRGRTPSTRLISVALGEPPIAAADALGLKPTELAWQVRRIRLADGEPIAREDGWYPAGPLPDLDQQDIAGGSLYEILGQHYGRWVDYAEQALWGEAADADSARELAAPLHTPLLVFRRISAAGGQPIEYAVSQYRGDRYQLHMELGQDGPAPAPRSTEAQGVR